MHCLKSVLLEHSLIINCKKKKKKKKKEEEEEEEDRKLYTICLDALYVSVL